MHIEPRGGSTIEKIVIHTNEGPETPNGAAGLAGYLQRIDGGYHAIFDDAHTVTTASDGTIVWGAGGMNTHALHGCFIHYSRDGWTDHYSAGELAQGAAWVAAKCRQYGITAVRLTPAQVATSGVKGICGHGDVSAVFAASQGHTDPGPNFPWGPFLASVNSLLRPPPKLNFAVIKALVAFVRSATKKPMRVHERSPRVAKLNALLARYGYRTHGPVYNVNTVAAVGHFKAHHKLNNRDGNVCGRSCLLALYKNAPRG